MRLTAWFGFSLRSILQARSPDDPSGALAGIDMVFTFGSALLQRNVLGAFVRAFGVNP
jgi:hypothetical protein